MIKLITNQLTLFNVFSPDSGIEKGTVEECLEWCNSQTEIEVDTETTGFDPLLCDVLTLQLGNKDIQFVIDVSTVDIRQFRGPLEDTTKTKLFWNAKFDCKFLMKYGIIVTNVYDGFLAECVLTTGIENRQLSLGANANKYLGKDLDKEVRGLIHKEKLSIRVIKYAAEDVEHLGKIKDLQMAKIIDLGLERTLELENKFIEVLAAIEFKGFKVDRSAWKELIKESETKLISQQAILDQWILNNKEAEAYVDKQMNLFATERVARTRIVKAKKMHYLFSSPKETIEFLKHIGIDTTVQDKKTGKMKDSCEAKHIKKFVKKSSFIPLYIAYKEVEKLLSTYGESFLQNLSPVDGRLHCEFWPILDTGRISSKEPNLQNIPSKGDMGPRIRRCFVPDDGNKLIINDYSAQEPRVTADKCGDPALIDFFLNDGGDIHSLVASKMFTVINGVETEVKNEKNHPNFKLRQIGKVIGLKLDYGGTAYTLKHDLGGTEAEAQAFIDAYYAAFPLKKQYFNRAIKDAFDKGYILIDSITNRKCFIEYFEHFKALDTRLKEANQYREKPNFTKAEWRDYFMMKGKIERNAMNYPIQGTSASMSKLAAIWIYREFKQKNLKAWIVNLIHDEIVTECEASIVKEVAQITRRCMEAAGKYFCKTVPMVAESDISDYWRK
jgi:DNA polymerase I